MANRTFSDINALQKAVILLEANCVIDSGQTSGTRSLKGSGVKAITKVATGQYKVQLEDSYFRYLGGSAGLVSGVSAPTTAVAAASVGGLYVITVLGTTSQAQWVVAGVPASVTAAVGVAFVASAAIATVTGTGKVGVPAASKVASVEVVGDPNLTLTNAADPHMWIQTLGATGAGDTTVIPVAPLDGSVLGLTFMLRNSSVKGKGE